MSIFVIGFIIGAIGVVLSNQWIYIIGFIVTVTGILKLHFGTKKKSIWRLILDIFAFTP